jgi:hypothetical protein
VVNKFLDILDKAWEEGRPMSRFGQTEGTGRYAPEEIGLALKMSKIKVKAMLKDMCRDGIIVTTMFNRNKKLKGLKSARLIEREKWWLDQWQASGSAQQSDGGSSNGNG